MKLVSASLLLVVFLVCSDTCRSQGANTSKPRNFKHNSKVESIYDKTKDQTTTYLRPMIIHTKPGTIEAEIIPEGRRVETIPREAVWLTAYFVSPGKKITRPPAIVIGLRFWGMDETTHHDDRRLVIGVDKSRLDCGPMELMERRIDQRMADYHYLVESFELALSLSTFVGITKATNVTLTFGSTELHLANEHLEAFRDLISRVE